MNASRSFPVNDEIIILYMKRKDIQSRTKMLRDNFARCVLPSLGEFDIIHLITLSR